MRPYAEVDLETFHQWFLVGITDQASGQQWDFQMVPGHPLDIVSITKLLSYYTMVTFNGNNYDLPMLALALAGCTNEQLKQANDMIIVKRVPWWTVLKTFGVRIPKWIDHIDVSEPAPGVRVSLKQYAGRCHAPSMVETAVDFNVPMPMEHVVDEIMYCRNDRQVTGIMRKQLKERLDLREQVTAEYGVDVRSKSDAQMAEAMFKAKLEQIINESEERHKDTLVAQYTTTELREMFPHLSIDYYRDTWGKIKFNIPHYNHGYKFKARVPDYIEFVTPQMQDFLALVRNCDFEVTDKEEAMILGLDEKPVKTGVQIPPELKGRDIHIGEGVYRVGIGGLHSQESSVAWHSIPGVQQLKTADVRSYYPSLIINTGMTSPQLGDSFQGEYQRIYRQRLAAKSRLKEIDGRLTELKARLKELEDAQRSVS